MFDFFKRKAAPPSPTGVTGQPFIVSIDKARDGDVAFHLSRIPEVEQDIKDLEAQGKDATEYKRALALHKFFVDMNRG